MRGCTRSASPGRASCARAIRWRTSGTCSLPSGLRRRRRIRYPVEMPIDPSGRYGGCDAAWTRGRRRVRPAHRHPRQRRQPVPTVAIRIVCRGGGLACPSRPAAPHRRHLGAVRARGGGRSDRAGPVGPCARAMRDRGCSTAASSLSSNCARLSSARRSSSAATAVRCTSPRPATSRSSALYGPTLPARSAPWRVDDWPARRSRSTARRAGRATSGSASRATSGA